MACDSLREWRIPTLIISHDPADVAAFADTLVLYAGGTALPQHDWSAHAAMFATEIPGDVAAELARRIAAINPNPE